MNDSKFFPGSSHYFIREGESRFILEHFGSEDPLFQERIEFKENLINDLVVRVADADLKIKLLLTAKEKYEEEKRKYLSAEVALECSLLDDALQTSLLEIAEIFAEFLNRLRTKIPAQSHLFRKFKKNLSKMDWGSQDAYAQSRSFLFPELDDAINSGKVKDSYFHTLANRLQTTGDSILKFRDKVLAHKYDEERFVTHLSFKQYCEIKDALASTLDAVAIVGTLCCNDWSMTRSPIEIPRTAQWLNEGLIAAACPIRWNMGVEPRYVKHGMKTVQSPNKPTDISQ
ncbi:MAG: hypothetical protein BGO14_00190 [Chlamydiales bacterium 38-26]|nr:hypothetical protein [Chlamydiales bacterium]OJV07483.1 MAG: hypothetical protein BGO14_00190 [Chlamydiales bacterium 38-26]